MAKNTTPKQIEALEDILKHPTEYRATEIADLPTVFLIEACWEIDKAIKALGGNAPCLTFLKRRFQVENLNRNNKS